MARARAGRGLALAAALAVAGGVARASPPGDPAPPRAAGAEGRSAATAGDTGPAEDAGRLPAQLEDTSEAPGSDSAGLPPAGLALRAGLEALEAGDPGAAATRFAAVAAAHPLVADHAERLRLRALAEAGETAAVRRGAAAFATRFPDSPVADAVWRLRAEAAAAEGDAEAARAAWREARRRAPDAEARAEMAAAVARSWEREGAAAEAAAAWSELYGRLAAAPAAEDAPEALVRLEAILGRPLRSAPLRAERARALYDARRNEDALAAAEAALGGALPASAREELARLRAFTLFRLRRYPQAAEAFAALGDDREARLYHARSLARSGEIDASVAAFEALGAQPGTSLGARALFLAATLLEDESDDERARARAHYATVAARAPAREQRAEARWRLGWLAWHDGDPQAAADAFAATGRLEADALEKLGPRYWHARALARLGREDEARAGLAALAAEYPLTYYGLRAAEHAPPAADGASPPPPTDPGALTLPETSLARAAILLAATLRDEARRELPALTRRVRTDADRLALGRLLLEAGDPNAGQQVVLQGQWERLARGPEPGVEGLWQLAWPRAFAAQVEAPARAHGVEPALVYAVMREESGYAPDAVSTVGALGLVQIMPETGRRLARRLGRTPFDPATLTQPAVNLELGAYYLSELLGRFRGRRSAAVAAYNAGPAAVDRWLAARGELPDDEWVEAIPYDQTRQYVRRVLRSWHAYRVLGAPD